jgi:hypothetical protein
MSEITVKREPGESVQITFVPSRGRFALVFVLGAVSGISGVLLAIMFLAGRCG